MGTDLIPILNHSLPFEGRSWAEIVAAIQPRLDALELEKPGGILALLLEQPTSGPPPLALPSRNTRWHPVADYLPVPDFDTDDNPQKSIRFDGPGGLSLRFDKYRIESLSPPYRYQQWFDLRYSDGTDATALRDHWRRYLRQVAQAFGGNRALYLADNAHPLTPYWLHEKSVAATEQQMRQELGEPRRTFEEVYEAEEKEAATSYFVDYFLDLK
ncbi:hypothetical protein QMK33_17110 [Hymenobacter sp. H14-R3]|uniref:hypothetical protein n=1 Tax=Hymenobacter sp. H14-R3 TaxID=3046308 RepID=UPI0024B9719E|nr:hypothetical protein [Hymenobacter sp. H14-R3]MDJ0366874.1 hypothetical protein [Hymenobacter sp. H14-R3]